MVRDLNSEMTPENATVLAFMISFKTIYLHVFGIGILVLVASALLTIFQHSLPILITVTRASIILKIDLPAHKP